MKLYICRPKFMARYLPAGRQGSVGPDFSEIFDFIKKSRILEKLRKSEDFLFFGIRASRLNREGPGFTDGK